MAKEQLIECIYGGMERLTDGRKALILRYFNGHIPKRDGYLYANRKFLSQLANRLQLDIVNINQ